MIKKATIVGLMTALPNVAMAVKECVQHGYHWVAVVGEGPCRRVVEYLRGRGLGAIGFTPVVADQNKPYMNPLEELHSGLDTNETGEAKADAIIAIDEVGIKALTAMPQKLLKGMPVYDTSAQKHSMTAAASMNALRGG